MYLRSSGALNLQSAYSTDYFEHLTSLNPFANESFSQIELDCPRLVMFEHEHQNERTDQ
jgi:hypothetical protein